MADPAYYSWKRKGVADHVKGFEKSLFGDKAEIAPCILADRACRLTGGNCTLSEGLNSLRACKEGPPRLPVSCRYSGINTAGQPRAHTSQVSHCSGLMTGLWVLPSGIVPISRQFHTRSEGLEVDRPERLSHVQGYGLPGCIH